MFQSCHQDEETIPDANRRGALEPTSLHGKSNFEWTTLFGTERSFFQIEISHKNQVPMLLAPPPKSRSLFSFLQLPRRKSDDFLDEN